VALNKKTFSFTPRQLKAINDEASRLGVNTAEVMRRIMDAFVEDVEKRPAPTKRK
jgi:hypothetical protein